MFSCLKVMKVRRNEYLEVWYFTLHYTTPVFNSCTLFPYLWLLLLCRRALPRTCGYFQTAVGDSQAAENDEGGWSTTSPEGSEGEEESQGEDDSDDEGESEDGDEHAGDDGSDDEDSDGEAFINAPREQTTPPLNPSLAARPLMAANTPTPERSGLNALLRAAAVTEEEAVNFKPSNARMSSLFAAGAAACEEEKEEEQDEEEEEEEEEEERERWAQEEVRSPRGQVGKTGQTTRTQVKVNCSAGKLIHTSLEHLIVLFACKCKSFSF